MTASIICRIWTYPHSVLVTLLLCHLYYDSHPLWKLRTVIEQEQITDSFHSEMVNGPTNLMIREKHHQA
ncbi:hypothetical protein JHK82_054761 [Glycine max]|uniref:Uncharacterized protein n=2 Tax=Glycine subgen. Soja TaxID=1462606 RepID=A0A0R0ETW1_SOYBN|nr:hypothetical protein JHK86_054613 [Glycine max]RZB49836.1 hypothetical protein D0Y65_052648 [Glycine soja]KAG4929082.1 hypothetical protein JHK85_055568 [Glycine max]KAG5084592.1 hypothetical protein JHK84_054630 [Glycine max]KAG5087364.1 hypothetical protein JHK82_054761 [Glycine max]